MRVDAVHLRPSSLSLHKRRFEGNRGNCLDVDRDDPHLVDSPKGTNATLVGAERSDVNAGKESGGAGMGTRIAQVLELHARAQPSLKVDSPRAVTSDSGLDVEDLSGDSSGFKLPPVFNALDEFGPDFVRDVRFVPSGVLLVSLGKRGVDLPDCHDEEPCRGTLPAITEGGVCRLGDVRRDVPVSW